MAPSVGMPISCMKGGRAWAGGLQVLTSGVCVCLAILAYTGVNDFQSKASVRLKIEEIKQDVVKLLAEKQRLDEHLELRKRQVAAVLYSLQDLQRSLGEDKKMEEEEKALQAEEGAQGGSQEDEVAEDEGGTQEGADMQVD